MEKLSMKMLQIANNKTGVMWLATKKISCYYSYKVTAYFFEKGMITCLY